MGSSLHLVLAPLFQAVSFAVFTALDVSLWSARLVSAASGSALLIVFWAACRRVASPEAALLPLAMLAVEMDMVALSRLAIPEMTAMTLTLAAFLLIVAERAGRLRLGIAGVLTAAAVGIKVTVLPVAAIFAAVTVLRQRPAPEDGLTRGAALGAFGAGFLAPALAAGAAAFAFTPFERLLRTVGGFVRLTDLYGLVSFPFDDTLAPVLGIWALAAWLGLLGSLAVVEGSAGDRSRRYVAAASLWAGLYAASMFTLDYFPSRYKLHILVPLAVVAAVGLTRLQDGGLAGLESGVGRLRGARRIAAALLIALPTAVVAGAALLSLIRLAGLDSEQMRVRYPSLLLLLGAVSALVLLRLRRGGGIGFLVWFPACWLCAWLIAARLSLVSPSFWPGVEAGGPALRWLLLLAAAAGAFGATRAVRWGRPVGSAALVTAAVLYAVLGVVRLAPGYLEPHYSMREASVDLGVLLAGAPGPISALGGEALFSENRLPYRSAMGGTWPASAPDVLILAGRIRDPEQRLGREYRLVRQYAIYVSPEYIVDEVSWKASEGPFLRTHIRVYRRIEGG